MKKKTYTVPVVWSMMGRIQVKANSPEEAFQKVKDHPENFSLPKDGDYLEDSFETAYEDDENVEEII